jgi:hydroxymethylbilane synthase
VVLSEDGGLSVRMSTTGPVEQAAQIGTRLAGDMLAEGAADLMEAPPVRNQHA